MVDALTSSLVSLGSVFGNLSASQMGMSNAYDYQKKLMHDQAKINYKYYEKELRNRWSLAREGLNNGNFNPMLAAIGNISGNSAWASPQSINDANFGSSASAGVANANTQRELDQMQGLRLAQTNNTNADSVLKNSETGLKLMEQITETYKQDLMSAETNLRNAEEQYKQKEISWYDYQVAQKDYQNATERYKAVAEHKDRVVNNSISAVDVNNQAVLMDSQIGMNNAQSLLTEQMIRRAEWENKHPVASRVLAPLAGGLSAGVGVGVGHHVKNVNFKGKRPIGFK